MTAKDSSLPNPPPLVQPGLPASRNRSSRLADRGTGDNLARFTGRGIDRRAWLTLGIPGLLLTTSLLAYGTWRWYYGYTKFGAVAAATWSRPYLLTGALVAAILALWFIERRAQGRQVVELFNNGIRIAHRRPKERFLLWEEIGGMASGSIEYRFFRQAMSKKNWVTIYPRAGRAITLDDRIQDLSGMAQQLKPLYFSNRMPALRKAFYADRWLSFGPLAIHRQALRVKKKLYPWKLVRDIRVQSGTLVITLDGKRPARFPTRKIPNLELMIAIIQEGVIP